MKQNGETLSRVFNEKPEQRNIPCQANNNTWGAWGLQRLVLFCIVFQESGILPT